MRSPIIVVGCLPAGMAPAAKWPGRACHQRSDERRSSSGDAGRGRPPDGIVKPRVVAGRGALATTRAPSAVRGSPEDPGREVPCREAGAQQRTDTAAGRRPHHDRGRPGVPAVVAEGSQHARVVRVPDQPAGPQHQPDVRHAAHPRALGTWAARPMSLSGRRHQNRGSNR